jgi:hypothetical protein
LQVCFPEIHITPTSSHARFNGVKYKAIQFAAPTIWIGDVEFDTEQACRANSEYVPAEMLEYQQGETSTVGFRKKKANTNELAPRVSAANRGKDANRDEEEDLNVGEQAASGVSRWGGAATFGLDGGRGRGSHQGRGNSKQPRGGAGCGSNSNRGGGQQATSAPRFSGMNAGCVQVHAGGNHTNTGRLDMVGKIADRYSFSR